MHWQCLHLSQLYKIGLIINLSSVISFRPLVHFLFLVFWSRIVLCLSLCSLFTARRVCIARTMLWQDVCLSVCHTSVFCLNDYTYPQSLFSPSSSPTILVFPHQTGWHIPMGTPLTVASNAKGYEQITIFDKYLALSRKWCKIEP